MTRQVREIVLLIADGLTIKEIQQELRLPAYKVKNHFQNILKKWHRILKFRLLYMTLRIKMSKKTESTKSPYDE